MSSISRKTLDDLEFHLVLNQVSEYCISELGAKEVHKICPITDNETRLEALHRVDEYLSSFENDNRIPNHSYYNIQKSIDLLGIENTFIEPKELLEIKYNVNIISTLTRFFKKFKELYPVLYLHVQETPVVKEIATLITTTITQHGQVSESASPVLKNIRKEINEVSGQIGASFNRALQRYQKSGYLDPIKESVVEGKRALAVQAMYRKKVNGLILGTSKTGSIIFIAPQATLKYLRTLQHLEYEEQEEVVRILKKLTDSLRPYRDLLILYQQYLTILDVIAAKAKYANAIHARLPKIVEEKKIYLREAYHPLLWQQNNTEGRPTIPQTLELNTQQQIIVISGPNAGGKSITLKTIGLLQVMLQSGLLIPVHEKSELSFFDTILTDIGYNQSIENQLSTYSYRLKNMRYFLRKSNANTLFLIDEFGTGSDPELGGALAEVFLEELYHKKAFGVITTHYANLKALADELEFACNANMQFDKRSLEPLFELVTGQAGSSFTFEVAQQNGISYRLINRAKKRVSQSKIRLDRTISKLQTERNELRHQSQTLKEEQGKASEKVQSLSDKQEKIQEKLEKFQSLYDDNQKMLRYGRIINELSNSYFQTNNKKKLIADFLKWIQEEKVKHFKKTTHKKQTRRQKQLDKKALEVKKQELKKTEEEVLQAVKQVRKEKQKKAVITTKKKIDYPYKIGDIVRLTDGRAEGVVEKVEKNKILINYGLFTTQAHKEKIELVRAKK